MGMKVMMVEIEEEIKKSNRSSQRFLSGEDPLFSPTKPVHQDLYQHTTRLPLGGAAFGYTNAGNGYTRIVLGWGGGLSSNTQSHFTLLQVSPLLHTSPFIVIADSITDALHGPCTCHLLIRGAVLDTAHTDSFHFKAARL